MCRIRFAAHRPHAQLVGRPLEEALRGAQREIHVTPEGAERDIVRFDGADIAAQQTVAGFGACIGSLLLQLAVVGIFTQILFDVMRRRRRGSRCLRGNIDAAASTMLWRVMQKLNELIVRHRVVSIHMENRLQLLRRHLFVQLKGGEKERERVRVCERQRERERERVCVCAPGAITNCGNC